MDADEKKLFDLFSQKENLASQEPALAAAFAPPARELDQGRERARALFAEGPALRLADAQRAALGGQRFPELQGVIDLLAQGLGRHPELAAEIGARPETLQRAAALDRVLGRLVWTGQLFWHGAENGELLTAAAADGLCQGILQRARAARTDPARTPAQRNAISNLFTEPLRAEAERREREAQAREASERSEQPLRAEISQADERAAMARVIEAFLDHLRRSP